MSDKDVDAQFADIVAHWNDAPVEPERAPRPTAAEPAGDHDPAGAGPDVPEPDGTSRRTPPPPAAPPATPPWPPSRGDRPRRRARPARFPGPSGSSPRRVCHQRTPSRSSRRRPGGRRSRWRSHEEHFEPGPTAPLPAGDLQFWGILTGLVGGPLLLLFLVLFNREGNPLWMLLAVGITVAGFGLLVQRLPRHRDDDDDGAVL